MATAKITAIDSSSGRITVNYVVDVDGTVFQHTLRYIVDPVQIHHVGAPVTLERIEADIAHEARKVQSVLDMATAVKVDDTDIVAKDDARKPVEPVEEVRP